MHNLPPPGSLLWERLFSGKSQPELGFLATKMMLDRLVRAYQRNPGTGTLQDCRSEFVEFLQKNQALPKIQTDIEAILRSGGAA